MKSYPVELRERVVGFVAGGGAKVDASRHFKVSRQTVYRHVAAQRGGSLNPIEHIWATLKKLLQKKLHKMKRKISFIMKTCLLLCEQNVTMPN